MMLGSIYRKVRRWAAFAALAGTGSVMALPGCDAEVSNTLVEGFESAASTAATSIISALFETVTRESPTIVDGVPVVMLDTIQQIASMLT